jgi:uncharacterized protein (DUF2236 family)
LLVTALKAAPANPTLLLNVVTTVLLMRAAPVQHAITQEIWGDTDALLLIFGGAAAEFAVNRAVDWLFFTGALPRDPIGRLFRTVRYAQSIAFAEPAAAGRTLEQIRRGHAAVEHARGESIPVWAYRAVLYMLIDYSERAAELLGSPLSSGAQQGLYADFCRIGEGLGVAELPPDYTTWRPDRALRLTEDLAWSPCTARLYAAYRCQLGPWRYRMLRQLQGVLVPPLVRQLLQLPGPARGTHLLAAFRALRYVHLAPAVRRLVIPPRHWHDLEALEPSQRSPLSPAA